MSVNTDRLHKLLALLERTPNDTFLLYGIAMEHKKLNDFPKAMEHLNRVLQLDPDYLYAYHQKGLVYEITGDLDSARDAYRQGITAATQKNDSHARQELQTALQAIE